MTKPCLDGPLAGSLPGAVLVLCCSQAVFAYVASEPGQPSREVTTIEELRQNGHKDLAKELDKAWKENGQKTPEQMEQEFEEQQKAKAAQEKERVEAEQAGKGPEKPVKLPLDAFSQQEKREPPLEEPLGGPGASPVAKGQGPIAQLKGSAPAEPRVDVPRVDDGKAVNEPPPPAAKGGGEKEDEKRKIKENIGGICDAKAQDKRAKALCLKYYDDVYFQAQAFGGWLGKIQGAMKADIKSKDLDKFPMIRFGEVPEGAAATWEGSPDGNGETLVTMGYFLPTTGKETEKVADHEIACHNGDCGKWDGSRLGENPKSDTEAPCYATMGCLNQGQCKERL